MEQFTECNPLVKYIQKHTGGIIGFVPTMGALHQGHISLVKRAREECDIVIVSVFVNPTQFNDKTDLKNYPRTVQADIDLLDSAHVDAVFIPTVEQIYPQEDTRVFDFGMIDKVMEGATRPGHFNGVAQVVSRLFDLVTPNRAYFGEKDFQQIAIIKEMVRQLNYNIEIVECPIFRGEDGLALSSRNALLDPAHRKAAPRIYQALKQAIELKNNHSVAEVERLTCEAIDSTPELKTIYFNIVNPATMQPIKNWDECNAPHGCVAVQAGAIRLIDNITLA